MLAVASVFQKRKALDDEELGHPCPSADATVVDVSIGA